MKSYCDAFMELKPIEEATQVVANET